MAEILIVEDDANKRLAIRTFLNETFPEINLRAANSLQSGLRALSASLPEAVVLDMTLPNYDQGPDEDGGIIHPLGGQEFLRKMKRKRLVVPVIILTQFETFGMGVDRLDLETLRGALQNRFGELCKAVIYYHSAVETWKVELGSTIASLLNGCEG